MATKAKNVNVFEYAAKNEAMFEANLANVGKKRMTTFYSDLSIAEFYGIKSINETFNNVMKNWIGSVEYIAEFILCLNWKSWQHYDSGNYSLSECYSKLFEKARDKVYRHYAKNKEASSYLYDYLD